MFPPPRPFTERTKSSEPTTTAAATPFCIAPPRRRPSDVVWEDPTGALEAVPHAAVPTRALAPYYPSQQLQQLLSLPPPTSAPPAPADPSPPGEGPGVGDGKGGAWGGGHGHDLPPLKRQRTTANDGPPGIADGGMDPDLRPAAAAGRPMVLPGPDPILDLVPCAAALGAGMDHKGPAGARCLRLLHAVWSHWAALRSGGQLSAEQFENLRRQLAVHAAVPAILPRPVAPSRPTAVPLGRGLYLNDDPKVCSLLPAGTAAQVSLVVLPPAGTPVAAAAAQGPGGGDASDGGGGEAGGRGQGGSDGQTPLVLEPGSGPAGAVRRLLLALGVPLLSSAARWTVELGADAGSADGASQLALRRLVAACVPFVQRYLYHRCPGGAVQYRRYEGAWADAGAWIEARPSCYAPSPHGNRGLQSQKGAWPWQGKAGTSAVPAHPLPLLALWCFRLISV